MRNFPYDLDQIANLHICEEALLDIKSYTRNHNTNFYEILMSSLAHNNFKLLEWDESMMHQIKPLKVNKDYELLKNIFIMIFEDLIYFPIPENTNKEGYSISYSDSWKAERTYGGERLHYGTDIMDVHNKRGYFPIVSITDGKIENIGWLEKGGYRIGIRAPSGAYFYYAHLYSFVNGLEKGCEVKAGQIIGFMGDSGYGEEGTIGKFPVHLHLGISLPLKNKEDEFWVNPYYILKYLEHNKLKSWY